jgi:TolA-binding protein
MQYSFRALILSLVATVCLSTAFVGAAGQSGTTPTATDKKTTTTTAAKPATATKTTSAKKTTVKKLTVDEQLQQLTNKLTQQQTQIQQQQSQIQQLQQTNGTLQQQVQQQGQTLHSSVQQATQQATAAQEGVNTLHTTVTDLQSTTQATANALLANKKSVDALENPLAIHYKGITITPGGWLESTFLVRGANENADITTNFGAVPLSGVANSNLSEFRASARGSRPIIVATGMAGSTKLTGYFEMDFLGQAPTANYVETNSFTPRQRQLWMQAEFKNGVTFTAGQFWSLLTTDRKGIATRSEFIPTTIEGSYVVGYSYARQNAVRITKDWSNKMWGAFEIASAQTTLSSSYTPANLMGFNTSPNALSPNSSTLNYLAGSAYGLSTDLAPDFIGKLAFEPGYGHYEIKGIVRMFRDRIASTADTTGSTNVTAGGGIGWAAILPIVPKKVDFVFEGLAGKGVGRYGAANQSDVTLEPNGNIVPLPAINSLAGFEFHPQPELDVFVYGGDQYVGKEAFSTLNAKGELAPAGYGSYLVNNSNCNLEVIPEGGAACGAQNKNLWDVTGGLWYRIYSGPFGRLQYGMQFEYISRNSWAAVKGGSPTGSEAVGLTSIRFYLP